MDGTIQPSSYLPVTPIAMTTKIPKPIDAYLPNLTHPDAKIRREAVKGVRYTKNPAAFEHLVYALRDESVAVLIHAIRGLEELGDPRAIAPLIARLDRASCDVCDEVGAALVSFGDAAISQLMAALTAEHPRVRAIAIGCLSRLDVDEAVMPISERLSDPDPMVITAALRALWSFNNPRTREALATFIGQPPETIPAADVFDKQREAAFALAELGDERAIDTLARSFSQTENRRCIDTIKQLGKIDSPRVRPLIEAYIAQDPESTCASQARATLAQLDAR